MICAGRRSFTSELDLFSLITVRNSLIIYCTKGCSLLLCLQLQFAFCVYSLGEGDLLLIHERMSIVELQIMKRFIYC
jgi:hypothetical protein